MGRCERRSRAARWRVAIAVAALAGGALIASEPSAASPTQGNETGRRALPPGISESPDGLCGGEPCDAVLRGLLHFFDRSPDGLGGNGRSCGDCHMVTDHFQLSPANAERRFQFLQWRRRFNPKADDPLFRPIDADDFRTNGDNASDFSNLRQNGLVRIIFPLPAQHQAHRSRDQPAVRGDVRGRVADGPHGQ